MIAHEGRDTHPGGGAGQIGASGDQESGFLDENGTHSIFF
jgi:hypothetical protein